MGGSAMNEKVANRREDLEALADREDLRCSKYAAALLDALEET